MHITNDIATNTTTTIDEAVKTYELPETEDGDAVTIAAPSLPDNLGMHLKDGKLSY